MKTRKIDFLVFGVQKAGTTALDHYMRKHPQIGMPLSTKELHFFDMESNFFDKKSILGKKLYLRKQSRAYEAYGKNFDFDSGHTVYGEITPDYIFWETACQRIWEFNPNIKLIAILRNPIDRAFSHWNMNVDRAVEKLSFDEAISTERVRSRENLPKQHRNYCYVSKGFYSEQIRRYQRFFNDEQMLFLKYDDFKVNQQKVLNDIFRFLGVDISSYNFEPKIVHNRAYSESITIDQRKLLLRVFEKEIAEVERLLDWDCSSWLQVD